MGSRWETIKDTTRPLSRSQSDIRRSLRSGVREGDPGVFYDDQGRLYYQGDRPGERQYPSSSLPRDTSQYKHQLRPDDTFTYDPRKTNSESRGPRAWKWSRGDTPRSSGRSNIITTNYDSYRKSPKMNFNNNYPGHVLPSGFSVGNDFSRDVVVRGSTKGRRIVREGSIMIEEHIVSHERPWLWPLFLIAGLLLFLIGIMNVIFCPDNHTYTKIWVTIFIVIFAIAGALHKGIYRGKGGKWRNVFHLIAGCVATVFVFFALGFVMIRLNHATLQITEKGSSGFIAWEDYRMTRYTEYPLVQLGSGYSSNIWACYAMDWVSIALLIICMAIVTSTIVIGNNYYNSNYMYQREVEPFCKPQLFNPYGQASLGQAIAFIGVVMKTTAHGNVSIEWQDYWITVWTAIFPLVAGPVTAIALKRCGLRKSKTLVIVAAILQFICIIIAIVGIGLTTYSMYENVLALNPAVAALLEFITFLVTIVTIIITTIGLYENIKALELGPMSVTTYSTNLLTYSIIMFAINDIVLLVGLIYALALFIRLVVEGCRKRDDEDTKSRTETRYYTEDRYRDQMPPTTTEYLPPQRDVMVTDGIQMFRENGDSRY